jgi:predicted MFS family arabinose efflux permease
MWLIGAGIMISNNLTQMCESLGFKPFHSAAITLFSLSQAASRVLMGALSEKALRYDIPRPLFLVIAAALMTAAHLVLVVAHNEAGVAIGVVLSGMAFGSVWPLMVSRWASSSAKPTWG